MMQASPNMRVIPNMTTGTTDGSFFRAAGIPTYGVDGGWIIAPDDERSHGLDERIPVMPGCEITSTVSIGLLPCA